MQNLSFFEQKTESAIVARMLNSGIETLERTLAIALAFGSEEIESESESPIIA